MGLDLGEGLALGGTRSQDQAVGADFADLATPQRVVEIEYQDPARQATFGAEHAHHQIAVERRGARADLLLRMVPEHRVVPAIEAMLRGLGIDGYQIDASIVRRGSKLVVQGCDPASARFREPVLVAAHQGAPQPAGRV